MSIEVAIFEKVSFGQFKKDWLNTFPEWKDEVDIDYMDKVIWNVWQNIKLPKRSTSGSAGYDFYMPCNLKIANLGAKKIPTGIRCNMNKGWVLQIFPRSGMGFKSGIHLANTVGIIDSDYYGSSNEGHIFIKLINDSALRSDIMLEEGKAFCQGIFLPYGITDDDNSTAIRDGGLGSTSR